MRVEIVGDYKSLQKSFSGASRSAKGFERDLGRSARGAVAASVSFRGLGRSIAFASSAFLGGAGIVYGIKSTISAAEESQRVLAQTQVAVRKSGLSWAEYGKTIREAALAQSNLSGFDDERLLGTFSTLVRRTGDVNRALKLNALAADVARGRNISLEQAAQLVLKASIGQAGALRRVGINAKLGSTGLQLIDMLSQKYAGSAEAYGKTAAGAQDRFRVAVQNLQEAIGTGLLPEITRLLNPLSEWLNDSKNQERVQKDVAGAAHTLVDVLKTLKGVVQKVDEVTGGFKHTLELLIALRFAAWATGIARGFGLIGGSAVVAEGEVSALRASLMSLGGMTVAPIAITLLVDEVINGKHGLLSRAATAASKAAAGAVGIDTSSNGQGPTYQQFLEASKHKDANYTNIEGYMKRKGITDPRMLPGGPLAKTLSATSGMGPHHGAGFSSSVSAAADATKVSGKKGTLSLQGQLNLAELAAAEASATKGVKDDLVALKRKAAILRAMIAKSGTLAEQTQRNQDLGSTLDQINALNQTATKTAATQKKTATKKVKAPLEFALPFKLQLAELKAQTTSSTADDQKVAMAEKKFAQKMIRSGKLKGQALLDAWQEIIDANSRLADKTTTAAKKHYHFASLASLTKGIKDPSVRKDVEARIAQAQAHSGAVYVKELHVKANNPDQLAEALKRKAKKGVAQRRGPNAGSYMGLH